MNTITTPKEIAGGFTVAGACLCLGVYFGVKAGGDPGTLFLRAFFIVAALTVLKYTFAWGRLRGFPARRKDGRWDATHILRNLVMAAIVWVGLVFLSGPFIMVAFHFAR